MTRGEKSIGLMEWPRVSHKEEKLEKVKRQALTGRLGCAVFDKDYFRGEPDRISEVRPATFQSTGSYKGLDPIDKLLGEIRA